MNGNWMSSAITTCRPALWAVAVVASAQAFAAEPAPERDARLDAMRQRAESLKLTVGDETEIHRVRPVPLLRYNDPTLTTTDGTLWLWEVRNRPVAAICLFMDSRDGFQWNYELVALKDDSLKVEGRALWNWRPQHPERGWQSITTPLPADMANQRLTQMKTLVALFEGEETINGELNRMRILPRPVHRYSAPEDGILDGALFLLVIGTNPEVLVQVEALKQTPPAWRVGFARMSSAELTVRHENDIVWQAKRVLEWNPRHEYFSHYGPDRDAAERQPVPGAGATP